MKKRILVCLTAMALSVSLFACGEEKKVDVNNNEANTEVTTEEATTTETATTDDKAHAAITYNGNTVSLFDNVDDAMTKLGEPTKKDDDEPSFNYYYDNAVQLIFYKEAGNVSLVGIYSFESGATTDKGIQVGSSFDDVKNAYGEPEYQEEIEGDLIVQYTYGDYTLGFTITDNKVSAISITSGMG